MEISFEGEEKHNSSDLCLENEEIMYRIYKYGIMCYGLMCFIMAPTITPVLDIVLPRNETRIRGLGFDLDYGVDMQVYWFWLWLHTNIAGIVVMFNIIAADIMFITLTIHTCYLFAIVRYKLEHVTDSIGERSVRSCDIRNFNIEYNPYQCEGEQMKLEQATAIKECVLSHKKAIELISCISLLIRSAQLLHYIYAWSLLIGAGLNVITISIAAVQLVSKMFQWAEMMMSAAFVIGVMMHLFFLSLMAQFILDESINIHESTYSSSWYNMSAMVQKDFILILMKSRSPCQLMAGKLFVMSLENYCAMKILLRQIQTEWERVSSKGENKILQNYASETKTFCIVYAIIMCGGLMCFILAPTISPMLDIVLPRNETRLRGLGFELDYGVDIQTYWFWLWLHSNMAGTVAIFNSIAADTMFIILTIHACYLFMIV
ncbi:PREDICTED: uncharacterized protein LOC106745656, partial [Dinoponera quadriceps]|uniref:Odorant receptor n=1 Tax=Dinoponera quadriceps TaxID=609295 RepID=A0A6P3XFT3_DINQU